jgi:hypothetical protein
MTLLGAVVVFAVGLVSGTVTRVFAGLAAIAALVLALLGVAAPDSVFTVIDPVLSVYEGNELLFLSGFLFGIAQDEVRGDE